MKIKFFLMIGISIFVILLISENTLVAQEDSLIIAHEDIFGKLKRPDVKFPHDIHMDVLADQDCGACHHSYDEASGSLTYEAGDEGYCKDCHMAEQDGSMPALREAYHGSCTVCHRSTIKEKAGNSGPTTCGECHKKHVTD
jgi:hypothetical protein